MRHNPILDELYAAREKLLADAGGDVHKYLEGVREREAASGLLVKTAQITDENRSTGSGFICGEKPQMTRSPNKSVNPIGDLGVI